MIERSKRTHGCTGCARASGARCPTTLIPNDGTIETMAPFVVRRLRRCQLDRGRCRGSKLAASRHKPVETANGVARQRPGATRSDQAVPVTGNARLHGGCERGFSNSRRSLSMETRARPRSPRNRPPSPRDQPRRVCQQERDLLESVEGDERPPRITRDC